MNEDNDLELLRLESERARVYGAKLEMAYVIAQREAEIKRINVSINVQEKRLLELDVLISKLKEE